MAQISPATRDTTVKVLGVGGGAGNAINCMVRAGVPGVEFVAVDSDADALSRSLASVTIYFHEQVTEGPGTAEIADRLTLDAREKLRQAISSADLLFIIAGMGGATGSGFAPAIAEIARELDVLTIGMVTLPFNFEGTRRRRAADAGIAGLRSAVNLLITVPDDRLLPLADKKTTMILAFALVDEVLRLAVQSISGTIATPGLIREDFAEVKRLLATGGSAGIGIGQASGPDRAVDAARQALASPLLYSPARDADSLLFVYTAADFAAADLANAAAIVRAEAKGGNAACLGTVADSSLGPDVEVMVIATGAHYAPKNRWGPRQGPVDPHSGPSHPFGPHSGTSRPSDPPFGGPPPADQRIPRRPPRSPFAGSAQAVPPNADQDEVEVIGNVSIPRLEPETAGSGEASPA